MDNTVFPYSPAIDAEPDAEFMQDIAEEALNAFFQVVCDRLDDLYPGTETTGDVGPGELYERELTALAWINSHATNNAAIAEATEAQYEDSAEDSAAL